MKVITLAFLLASVIYSSVLGQNCAPNGITTNPYAPVNNQVQSKVNTFNWLDITYSLNWIYDQSTAITSPFYQTNNSITNHFIDNKEMNPSDGWELIHRGFGFMDDGTPQNPSEGNPYLVLYNKYTGILRVFVARGDDAPFNGVKLFIRFANGSPMQTSLLSQTQSLIAIDHEFERDPIFETVSEFNNDYQRWFYADFNMIYDPCTCLYESKLWIGAYLVNSSLISLEGSSYGELVNMNNNQGTVNNTGRVWTLGNLADGANKLGSFYKTLDSYKTKEKDNVDSNTIPSYYKPTKKSSIESLANAVSSSSFLRNGLASFPFIGSAISMIDFFVGGGKKSSGPTTVKVMPMTINMTNRFHGYITAQYLYKDIIFWNPGSNNTDFDLNEYPYYNEVMGTFNLLRTPIANLVLTREHYFNSETFEMIFNSLYQYRFELPLEYIINPASGLEVQEIKIAMIVEGNELGPIGGGYFSELEGFDGDTKKYQYRTDYVDIACFNQQIFEIQGSSENGNFNWQPEGGTYIKIMANLRRINSDENTQNVLFVAKYPVTVNLTNDLGNMGSCAPVPPQTQAAVQSYCTSTAYTLSTRFLRYKENLEEILKEEKLKQQNLKLEEYNEGLVIFPNPANNKATLRYSVSLSQHVKLEVKDLLGRNIMTLADHWSAPGNYEIEIFTEQFRAGTYLIFFENGQKREVKQLVINK